MSDETHTRYLTDEHAAAARSDEPGPPAQTVRQVNPWAHREIGYSAEHAAHTETLLALSNGYLGIRGTLDEGAPAALRGTYLAGFHETRPLRLSDPGYADPEVDQVLVDVPDGTRMRLLVEGEAVDVREGTVLEHERQLDLRAGVLTRKLRWRSSAGHEVIVRTRRLVSLHHRELAAIEYAVEPAGRSVHVVLCSDLVVPNDDPPATGDPRAGEHLPPDALVPRRAQGFERGAVLVHETRHSANVLASGVDHLVLDSAQRREEMAVTSSGAHWSLTALAGPAKPVRVVKLLAYHWARRGVPEVLLADAQRSLALARELGYDGLASLQRRILDDLWARADVELDGDPELQHALRYALFQLHQNATCAGGRAIAAKGLTGPGYNGHTFWDTEVFMLPALTQCSPSVAADALRWRASTLPQARDRASRLGLRGAAFAWRTIDGEDCSTYLPAGTAAFHVNAGIAHAVVAYVETTGDEEFERDTGAPLLVETARLWVSLGYHDPQRDQRFSIDGVTGPDEYSALVDNNLYTNLMAQANLRAAAEVVDRVGREALGVEADEIVAWRRAADAMTIPFDAERGIHLQDEDFCRHAPFDFAAATPDRFPLLLHVPYFELYRRQVVKQPDLVLAMVLRGDAFSVAEKRANLAYYEALTVRDSSLSAGTEAVIAAELGDVQLAHDYLAEAILLDHHDSAHNTADGLHLGALAGGWTAVVSGLAGVRIHNDRLSFAPRLPKGIARIAFHYTYKDRRVHVEVTPAEAAYELRTGASLDIEHWGDQFSLAPGGSAHRSIPAAQTVPVLRQPHGRSPRRHRPVA